MKSLQTNKDQAVGRGAALAAGYDVSRLNSLRHGILSRFTVLPWEEAAEYESLHSALAAEHCPSGPTEEHLVEEIAGVLWRKRRLRMAEAASFNRGLQATTDTYSKTAAAALIAAGANCKVNVADAIKTTPHEARRELAALDVDENMTLSAIQVLQRARPDAYSEAVKALHESTHAVWTDQLAWEPGDYDEETAPYTDDATSLLRYLETSIVPWYGERRNELRSSPLVRAQALGEALDPDKLERLGRYEVHLDRKFERTLSTLLRLQELRRAKSAAATA